MENDDTDLGGGEELSLDEAAARYAQTTTAEPQGQTAEEDDAGEQEPEDPDAAAEEAVAGDDSEPDDDGQAEDEDEAEPETERGRYVAHNGRVKLPDGSESTVADLIQGNLRDRDYRQKTMAAADLRREVEGRSAAVKQREQQLDEQTQYVTDLVRSIVPPPPDISMLDENSPNWNPAKYQLEEARHRQWMQHLQHLEGQRRQTAQQAQEEANRKTQERAQAEWDALIEAVPELKDEKSLKAFADDLKSFGPKYGLTPEDIAAVPLDHRYAVVLRKAISWDKLQSSKATVRKQVEGRPPVTRGSRRPNPAERRADAVSTRLKTLEQSGRMEDAVAAYMEIQSKRG